MMKKNKKIVLCIAIVCMLLVLIPLPRKIDLQRSIPLSTSSLLSVDNRVFPDVETADFSVKGWGFNFLFLPDRYSLTLNTSTGEVYRCVFRQTQTNGDGTKEVRFSLQNEDNNPNFAYWFFLKLFEEPIGIWIPQY